MAFHDIRIEDDVSYGAEMGPGWNTAIVTQTGGVEERIGRWEQFRVRGTFNLSDHDWPTVAAVRDFAIARRGALHSFRWKDWSDYATTATGTTHNKDDATVDDEDVEIGTGDASETQFQLIKKYEPASAYTRSRNVTLPVAGTVLIALDGVAQTEGVDFTVNDTTGIVTFTSAPGNGVSITAGFEFDTLVRFDGGVDDLLGISLAAYDKGEIIEVQVIEVRDELQVPADRYPGGAKFHENLSADVAISLAQGSYHTVEPGVASLSVILPRADDIPTGPEIFAITNSGTFSIDVDNEDAATVITLAVGETAIIHLGFDGGGAKVWAGHA